MWSCAIQLFVLKCVQQREQESQETLFTGIWHLENTHQKNERKTRDEVKVSLSFSSFFFLALLWVKLQESAGGYKVFYSYVIYVTHSETTDIQEATDWKFPPLWAPCDSSL